MKEAMKTTACTCRRNLHPHLKDTSFRRESWNPQSKLLMNLQLACSQTYTRLWITLTRSAMLPFSCLLFQFIDSDCSNEIHPCMLGRFIPFSYLSFLSFPFGSFSVFVVYDTNAQYLFLSYLSRTPSRCALERMSLRAFCSRCVTSTQWWRSAASSVLKAGTGLIRSTLVT